MNVLLDNRFYRQLQRNTNHVMVLLVLVSMLFPSVATVALHESNSMIGVGYAHDFFCDELCDEHPDPSSPGLGI
ncbi:MAG: hypothetical protein R2867_16385 [Caldilineaceae bacterium]